MRLFGLSIRDNNISAALILISPRAKTVTRSNGEYYAAGQLTRLTDTSGHGIRLQQFKYEYSLSGLLLKEENKQYTYDTLKRLRSGAEPDCVVHYTYDHPYLLILKKNNFKEA